MDKQYSLINLSNSLLKHFGVDTFHDSIPEVDEALKGHKKVVAVLFDGMGQNIIHKHLKENSFIRKHYFTTIDSTFPPTTAAATTSFLTGKYPIETGWLSWDMYFKDLDRNIILFKNKDFNTGEKLPLINGKTIANTYYPTNTILELIKNKNKDVSTFCVQRYPIQEDGPKSLLFTAVRKISKILKNNDKLLGYFYWDSPDAEMHRYGIDNFRVHYQVRKAERFIKKISRKNKDTVFILLADHGHINYKQFDICEHEDLYSLVVKPLSMEKRSACIFVKEGKQEQFKTLFNKYYGDYFDLYTKKDALDSNLFGEGEPCKGVLDAIGDFIAVARKEYGLFASKEFDHIHSYKGHHGGGTKEERLIDISIFNK